MAAEIKTAAQLLEKMQTDLGEKSGEFGGQMYDQPRLPTGFFEFDLASGGGFPRGRASTVYGMESCNKTNMILAAIANNQKLRPNETNVFIAVEPFDKIWAEKMGVDTSKLIVMRPKFAEEVVDMAESFLYTTDCGVVAIDSIAAMMSTAEGENQKGAIGQNPGSNAIAVNKLVRKTTLALMEAEKAGRYPTLLYINQIRMKIGVMFGSPETRPGGPSIDFQVAMRVRLYGKNITDAKVSDTMPVLKQVQFTINKWKVPIFADSGQYSMATVPHKKLKVGECDDFNTVAEYMKNYGWLLKTKNGWELQSVEFKTLSAIRDVMMENPTHALALKNEIINEAMKKGYVA